MIKIEADNSVLGEYDAERCYKQTKNRSVTRLTVLSKRLGRKRCCDATPDRCLRGVPSHYLRFALKKMRCLLAKIEGLGGIPGLEAYQMKK